MALRISRDTTAITAPSLGKMEAYSFCTHTVCCYPLHKVRVYCIHTYNAMQQLIHQTVLHLSTQACGTYTVDGQMETEAAPCGLAGEGNVYVPSGFGGGIRLYLAASSRAISFQRINGLLVQYSTASAWLPDKFCVADFKVANSAWYSGELTAAGASTTISVALENKMGCQLPPSTSKFENSYAVNLKNVGRSFSQPVTAAISNTTLRLMVNIFFIIVKSKCKLIGNASTDVCGFAHVLLPNVGLKVAIMLKPSAVQGLSGSTV